MITLKKLDYSKTLHSEQVQDARQDFARINKGGDKWEMI
jgi:hypothetical protein